MKKNFLKNILVFIFSLLGVLLYFKILVSNVEIDILAQYFEIKALGMIAYYFFSIRYSEFSYLLKAQNNYSLYRMNKIYSLYVVFVLLLSILLILGSSLFLIVVKLYIYSYLIFLLNDLIDSYIAINRLYHKYKLILFYKGFLLFKPLLIYLYLINGYDITIDNLFTFELVFNFSFALIMLFIIYRKVGLSNVFIYKAIYIKNIMNIKNTWLGSISKIPYEAFPTYLLSMVVSSQLFVEYNIARKVYSMVIYSNQPFMQVLNTYSITFKDNFKKYLTIYYGIVILLNFLIAIIIFNYTDHAISFLADAKYVTLHTTSLLFLMFIMYMFYLLIYPIRQYIVLFNYILSNNLAILISTGIIFISTLVFIPIYNTYALSIIQPLGLILPIFITIIINQTTKYSTKP